jgi:hypothetical protein
MRTAKRACEAEAVHRRARRRAPAIIPTAPAPKAQKRPFVLPPGATAHDTFAFTDSCPLHVLPSHSDEPVAVALALICAVRTPFSAATHCSTSDVLTYSPLQMIAPVPWHCVMQSLTSSDLHVW